MGSVTASSGPRLAGFILENVDLILTEWEDFAREIWPATESSLKNLRDDAEEILRAIAVDMETEQTSAGQAEKSKGAGEASESSMRVNRASDEHVLCRIESGFDLLLVVAEYRALRASVIRLWETCHTEPYTGQIDEMIRFNESMDQLLTEAVRYYTERVEQSRDIFLGIMGHDLRNPLVAITMLSELLRQPNSRADAADVAGKIQASATAMRRMIADILDFARTRLGGEMAIFPAAMDLGDLGREVLDEMKAAYPTRVFRLECHGELHGEWDAARLRQLLANLLCNAVQHGSATSPVGLSIRGDAEELWIRVTNQGPPIPGNLRELIFEPLTRKPSAVSAESADSIGLGLFIVREIATRHGGSAAVESSCGETVFTVRLPRKR